VVCWAENELVFTGREAQLGQVRFPEAYSAPGLDFFVVFA